MTPVEWYNSNDTGISSMSIFLVMMNLIPEPAQCDGKLNIPHDASDFGRCYRMLTHFPEWRERLDEVAIKLPKWRPIIEHWPEMETLYITNQGPALSLLLRDLEPACMEADGWQRICQNGWIRSTHA